MKLFNKNKIDPIHFNFRFYSDNVQKIGRLLFLILPLIFGIWNFPLKVLGAHLEMMPGDTGDARLINYVLEHGFQFLSGKQSSFYNAPFFFPTLNTMSLTDNMTGSLPLYSIFRFLGFEREMAFQLWWLTVFVLNYFISFFCFKKFSGNFYASVVVAWLFTFSILNVVNLSYTQVNSKYMLPLIFLFFFNWLKSSEVKYFYLLLGAFFFQLLISVYFAIFAILFLIIISIVHFFISKSLMPYSEMFQHPVRTKNQWLAFVLTVLLSLLFLYPNIQVVDDTVHLRTYEGVFEVVPRLQSFVSAPPHSHWRDVIGFGADYFPNNFWLHQYFPGGFVFIVILSLPIFIYLKRKNIERQFFILLISFVLLFFVSIRWNQTFSPLKYLYDIHFFAPITMAGRIMIPLELLFLFLVLYVLSKTFENVNKILKFLFIVFVLIFIMWDNKLDEKWLSGLKKQLLCDRYAKVEQAVKKQNKLNLKVIAIVSANNSPDRTFILDAMLVSQKLGLKCINGYSSNAPSPSAADFWMFPTKDVLSNYCKVNNMNINDVLVIEDPNPPVIPK